MKCTLRLTNAVLLAIVLVTVKAATNSANGSNQSPIAIVIKDAVPLTIESLQFVGYDKNLPGPVSIQNNGSTVTVIIPKPGRNDAVQMPYITGGPLKGIYELENVHWHWGANNQRGSEHTLDGVRYPMEMHVVHRNKKYKDIDEAITHSDGLAILGFFYTINSKDSVGLAKITNKLRLVRQPNTQSNIDADLKMYSLITISTEKFFTYNGSLTSPPYSDAATWIIFAETLAVSSNQLTEYRSLYNSEGSPLEDNFRELQPLGDRKVYLRDSQHGLGQVIENIFSGISNFIHNLF